MSLDNLNTAIVLTEEESISTALATVGIEAIKNELQKNVDFSKSLEIKDFSDKKQIQVVKDTKNGYVKTRNTISRAFKLKRDDYNKLAKQNIEAEKEVLTVIATEEARLEAMIDKAELLALRKENGSVLDERKTRLSEYSADIGDDALLEMTDQVFEATLLAKKEEYLIKVEAELKIEKDRVERAKEIEAAKKAAKEEAEKIAKREAEQAQKDAEESKNKAVQEAKNKAEAEKQAILMAQKAKEDDEKREQEVREIERAKAEYNEKYQGWIKTLPEGAEIRNLGNTFSAWVKVGEITI